MAHKKVTSQDVANLAGVSRTTVSFVLNDVKNFSITPETRQKVLAAAEQLGYVPNVNAQALAAKRAKAIGLIMTRSPQYIASDPFLPQIIGGLLDIVKQEKLSLILEWVEPGHQTRAYRELAHAKSIDGMILLTPRHDDEGLRSLETLDIPVVLMGELPELDIYSVDVDNRAAARMAVQHLVDLGHKKIACITNAPQPFSSATDRLLGYQDALAQAGIAYDSQRVCFADFTPGSGFHCMNTLLDRGADFTAAFVASDNVAIGALSAIHKRGFRVPDDFSIVGFDDILWARFSDPPLTTIRIPAQDLARNACYLLMDVIKGNAPESKQIRLNSELILRQSCRKLA